MSSAAEIRYSDGLPYHWLQNYSISISVYSHRLLRSFCRLEFLTPPTMRQLTGCCHLVTPSRGPITGCYRQQPDCPWLILFPLHMFSSLARWDTGLGTCCGGVVEENKKQINVRNNVVCYCDCYELTTHTVSISYGICEITDTNTLTLRLKKNRRFQQED